jgi:general secretion pathway protein K
MKRKDERGIALLLVLLILSLLIPLILEFDAEARRELREAAAFRDNFKAVTLVRSGVQAARAILRYDTQLDLQAGRAYDGPTDVWATPISNYRLGDGIIGAKIEDERGKFNLNDLSGQAGSSGKTAKIDRLKRLFQLLQTDPRLVEVIVDWVDANDAAEPNGAESAYYLSRTPPYRAANGPMQTVDELRLLKGFTDEVVRKIVPYVTVYPPDGLINVNTAHPFVLQALDARMTPTIVQDVVRARPFRTIQDLDRVKGVEPIAKELRTVGVYTVRSDHFSARVTATIHEVTKTARAVIQRTTTSGESALLYLRLE